MSNTKFSFEPKKIEATEQQPIKPIEKNSIFEKINKIFVLIAFAIILYNMIKYLPVLALMTFVIILFVALVSIFDTQIVKIYGFCAKVIEWIVIAIGWLIIAAIAIWFAIKVFNGLSAPIASMPVGGVIIIVAWLVACGNNK